MFSKSQQAVNRHGCTGRCGTVISSFGTHDKRLVRCAGEEETAAVLVPELLNHQLREAFRFGEPARFKTGLVEGNEAGDEVGIVLKVGVEVAFAGAVRA